MSFRPHHHVRTSAVSVRKSCITRRAVSTWALVGRYILMKSTSVLLYGWRCVVRNSWRARQKRTQVVCGITTNKFEWWRKEYGHVWLWTDGHLPVRCLYITHKGTCRSIRRASGACIGSVLPAYSIFPWLQICTYVLERTMCHSLMRETAIRLSKWCGPSKLCIKTGTILYHSFGLRRKMSSLVTY
jgi:hypothetical protein